MVSVLKQAEQGVQVAELTRKLGSPSRHSIAGKKEYGGLESGQARELKQLQEENARLKRLVADLCLDEAILE